MRLGRLLRRIGIGFVVTIAIVPVVVMLWAEIGRWRVAEQRRIASPPGIEALEKLRIGGIDQWISIRGRDRRNPVLLFLHGGPGFPMMPFAHLFQTPWERYFTVVQWDQRGTGKTFRAADPDAIRRTMTHERMLEDAHELTLHLRQRFGQDRIVLVAHSWGTMLGLPLVHRYPELFHAYVGTGQVISVFENERVGYQRTLEVARERHDARAIAELEALAPYPDPVKGTSAPRKVLRKWQRELGLATRGKSDREMFIEMLAAGLRSPDYSLADNLTWITMASSTFSRDALAAEIDRFDVQRLGTRYEVPVIFMLGRDDWQVPSVIAARFARRIETPHSRVIWFEESAHSPPSEEPQAFLDALVREVLPLTRTRARAPEPADLERSP